MPQARDKRAGDATAEQPRKKKPAAGAPLTLAAEMEQLAAVAAGVQQRMSTMGRMGAATSATTPQQSSKKRQLEPAPLPPATSNWATMSAANLRTLLHHERQQLEEKHREVSQLRLQLSLAASHIGADLRQCLSATQEQLSAAQEELSVAQKQRERLQRYEDASQTLQAAGLQPMLSNLAEAILTERLVLTSICAIHLSDLSRNLLVHPKQHRYHPEAQKHWAYVETSRSGKTALEALGTGNDDPRFRGLVVPSHTAMVSWRKAAMHTSTSSGVGVTGFFVNQAAMFAEHLLLQHGLFMACGIEGGKGGEGGEGAEGGQAYPLPELPYRIAHDGTGLTPELYTHPRTGAYTGDEDLSSAGIGTSAVSQAAMRRSWAGPLEQLSEGGEAIDRGMAIGTLLRTAHMVRRVALPEFRAAVAQRLADYEARCKRYEERIQRGKGAPSAPWVVWPERGAGVWGRTLQTGPGGDGGGGGGGSVGGGGGVCLGLALRLQHLHEHLADLPGARSQVWLLLSQLGEQRLEAEAGISHAQPTHRLKEGVGRAGFAHARCARRRPRPTHPSLG